MTEERFIKLSGLPPSANAIWRKGRGHHFYRSKEYVSWITASLWEAKIQKVKPIEGRFGIRILIPRKMRGDADNRVKPTLDFLQKAVIIKNDSLADEVTIRRDDITGMHIYLWPSE